MNKKIMVAIGAMAIAAVLGLLFSQTLSVSADPDLSEEDVREKVEEQYPGEITALALESSGNNPIYEIEIDIDGKAYKLSIDGNSGEVLQLDEKAMIAMEDENKNNEHKKTDAAISTKKEDSSLQIKEKIDRKEKVDEQEEETEKQEPKEKPKEEEPEEQPKEKEKPKEQPKENKDDNKKEERSIISTDRAIEIAQGQFSGTVDDIELDTEDGRLIYEIEIESSRGDADIEIDAYTGEVIKVDIDLDD